MRDTNRVTSSLPQSNTSTLKERYRAIDTTGFRWIQLSGLFSVLFIAHLLAGVCYLVKAAVEAFRGDWAAWAEMLAIAAVFLVLAPCFKFVASKLAARGAQKLLNLN